MSGRGGAGNIYRAQEQKKVAVEDLEANSATTSTQTSIPSSTSTQQQQQQQQTYAHTGRGGAGNWYQPSQLSQTGTFTSTTSSTLDGVDEGSHPMAPTTPQISTPWHPETQQLPIAKAGRGGAGNFVWGTNDEEEDKKKREQELKIKEVEERVERDVEAGLAKPAGAVLGNAKAGRGW